MNPIKLSLKNLTRQKRRNATLALAIAFGFFIVTLLDSFTSGIVTNMESQITQLVGGTVLVQGLEKKPAENEYEKSTIINIVKDRTYIKNIVENSNIKYKNLACYSQATSTFIFEGNKSIATVYGRDFSDKDFIDSLQFIEGGIEEINQKNSIIISEKTANSLNVHNNDTIILKTQTIYGQNAVEDFTVKGIIKGNSFISTIMAYTNIGDLNKLIELPDDGYSIFSVYLENKDDQYKLADYIEEAIKKDGNNVTSRAEAIKTNPSNIGKGIEKQIIPEEIQWDGVKYAVETLYDEFPQIVSVFLVIHMVTFVILLVILLIVMVGIANTYKMVLFERIREIGTMRAIGMNRTTTKRVFKWEAILLCVTGALVGLILAFITIGIISLIPINSEVLSFFLFKNHFTFKVSVGSILIQYILLIVLTTFAVSKTANKASKMSPAEALRTIK